MTRPIGKKRLNIPNITGNITVIIFCWLI